MDDVAILRQQIILELLQGEDDWLLERKVARLLKGHPSFAPGLQLRLRQVTAALQRLEARQPALVVSQPDPVGSDAMEWRVLAGWVARDQWERRQCRGHSNVG